jgi:hypothetical protein
VLTASDEDMDLLGDNEFPLIKDGSPPPIGMVINMVFTPPTEFRGVEEEVAQISLGPEEAVFKMPEESSHHLKSLYIRCHIDGRPISMMLIDDGTVINLMPYFMFKKLIREDDKLMKTNLPLNVVGATLWRLEMSSPWSLP